MIGIVSALMSIIGIIGFFSEALFLTYIAAVVCVIENIFGVVTGQQKSFSTLIIAIIIGIGVAMGNQMEILDGVAIAVCFENVIMQVGGLILILVIGSTLKK